MSVYDSSQDPPEDHIQTLRGSPNRPSTPTHPSFGIDSPAGLLMSNVTSPLYLYATLSGKHKFWANLLSQLPDEVFLASSLDVGCGRGTVLVKVAQRKKALDEKREPRGQSKPAYGIDIFNSSDQTGNSPEATYRNAAALGVLDFIVLHTGDFIKKLSFADGVFGLVTSSLALHNANEERDRLAALKEMARVCAPGGRIVLVDLHWVVSEHFKAYRTVLEGLGWTDVNVEFAGATMMFGILPCQVLTAIKPKEPK